MNGMQRCLILGLVLSPTIASAGMIAQCNTPAMFAASPVTVLVFPYVDYTSEESSRFESPVGTELAGLIHADTLLAISPFGHVAAIRLLGNPSDCEPSKVLGQLLARYPRHNGGIVMISGRIFRVASDIYIQSYVSFSRFADKDPGEMVQLPVGDSMLVGKLASQTLTFPPRHVSEQDLGQIRERFSRENIVHDKPDELSPGKPLLVLFPNERRPLYYLTDSEGDWFHIRTQTGQEGWILGRAMLGRESLRNRLPEMSFVQGVAGYFGFRSQPTSSRAELATADLRSFEGSPSSDTAPLALAVSKQLRGMIQLLSQNQSNAAFDGANLLFAEATKIVPSSSNASNMASVASIYRQWKDPGGRLDFQKTVEQFWSSVSADPEDKTALTNCWIIFQMARNAQFRPRFTFDPPLSDEDLSRRTQQMEDVQLGGSRVQLAHSTPVVPWPKPQ